MPKTCIQTLNRFFPIIFLIGIILFFISTLSLLSFLSVVTSEEALNRGYPPLPGNWEAGVFSHGSYYKWFTIVDQPILFVFSIAMFLIAWSLIIVSAMSIRKALLTKYDF